MDNNLSHRLDGRIALVTGASRGIGEAIATLLAERGAHVVVSSRKAEACTEVVDKIRAAGGSADAVACHIGDMAQIEATLRRIDDAHGQLDILVNNAAANPYFGHVIDTDASAYQKTVDVNIRGYFFTTSHAARLMKKQKKGAVVNVASISGVVPGPNQGIYSITKAAVISMTKVFAAECAEFGIRVNAVLPGITDTKFAAALVQDEAMLGQYLPRVPLQRVARPEEMAGAVAFLASDASSYTTGACLNVDGGYLVS